jgi:ABC-type branched-subunit amino acid transport system substrate-binding protein
LINSYPQSDYVDDSRYLLAAISFKQGQYYASAEKLFTLLETASDPRLRDLAVVRLPDLLLGYLEAQQVQYLRDRFQTSPSQQFFSLFDAVGEHLRGNRDHAQAVLQRLLAESLSESYRDEVRKYISTIANLSSGPLKIGVILPITGFFEEEAKALLRGLQFALEENPVARELGVKAVVRDSQGESLTAITAARELIGKENTVAIIGEIESDKTAIVGALAESSQTPVIAPTAIETGLTQVGINIFQMNPDVTAKGQKIAEYAISQLNLRSFAILAPADKYGRDITDGFAQKIDQLNGSIVAETWYYEGATDVREQISRFRTLGLRKMLRDSILQEMPFLTRSEIDSVAEVINEMRREKEEEEKEENIELADSTATAVTSIDGIFLPVYTEHIPYVAPQLALYNIQAQLIGGNYWNDEDVLIDNDPYVQGAVFSTDYFLDENSDTFQRFRDRFRAKMGVSPGKLEIAGFDSMNFLLSGIKLSNQTRRDLLDKLKSISTFQGLAASYQFGEDTRMNTNLTMLKYQNSTIRKLE